MEYERPYLACSEKAEKIDLNPCDLACLDQPLRANNKGISVMDKEKRSAVKRTLDINRNSLTPNGLSKIVGSYYQPSRRYGGKNTFSLNLSIKDRKNTTNHIESFVFKTKTFTNRIDATQQFQHR
jgi:hypothetical protein